MATTFSTTYNTQEALQKPLIVTLTSTNTAEEKFRYILQVYVNTVLVATIKQQANSADDANFDVWRILETYKGIRFESSSGVQMHGYNLALASDGEVNYIQLKAGEEYAASATENTTEYLAQATETFAVLNGVWQFTEGLSPSLDDYVYHDNTDTLKFLTKSPSTVRARLEDEGMIAFWNGDLDSPVTALGALTLGIRFFDRTNTQTGATVTKALIADLSAEAVVADDIEGNYTYLATYLPFYPANIEAITGVTIPLDASYYTYQITSNNVTPVEWELKTVQLYEDCKYSSIRLAWQNDLSTWDYFNFELLSENSINIDRKSLVKPYGNWDSTSFTYGYDERGKAIYDISAENEYTVNSNWLTDDEFTWLRGLLMSKEVQFYNGSVWIPVVITDSSYTIKKKVNGKLNNLQLKFQTAHKLR